MKPDRAQDSPALLAWLPWLSLLIGLGTTFAVWHHTRADALQARQDRFNFYVAEVVGDIENRMRAYEQILHGMAALFSASRDVSRDEFRTYVESLQLAKSYPGIQGIGFSLLVPAADKRRHVEDMRRQGFADYRLHPEGERDPYTSILYIEPFDWRNRRAFGYDMYAHPVRSEAMRRAWESGLTAISGKVTLVQETDQDVQPGFLMYEPIYRYRSRHGTLEERRANLRGWAYAPFRAKDLLQGILRRHYGEKNAVLDLEIYDGAELTPQYLLYDSDQASRLTAATASHYLATREIVIGGRTWTVLIGSLNEFEASGRMGRLALIAIIGIVGSLLLFVVAWQLINGRQRAISLARRMNHELMESERYQKELLTDLPVAVVVHGADTTIQYCNAEACRLLDANAADVVGKTADSPIWSFVHENGEPMEPADYPVNRVLGEQAPLSGYVGGIVRDAGADPRWVHINAYPFFAPAGHIDHVVVTFLDITARRKAKLALERLSSFYMVLSLANRAIVRISDIDSLLAEICRIAVEQGGFVMAWAGRVDAGRVTPYAKFGREDGYLEQVRIIVEDRALGAGPTGSAIREGQHFICDDIAADPRMEPWRALALARGYRASAAFPIRVAGNVVGAINLYAPSAGYFSPDVVELIDDLTEDVSFAMNAQLDATCRRQAEADLRQLNEQLEQRVQQRTRELEVANQELEAFSYSVSHDLRAPLRSIDGFSQVLLKRYADKLDDTGQDYLGRVRRASQRMGELIDDLLQLSRMTRSPLHRQEIDLSAMAAALCQELQRSAPERQVMVKIQPDLRTFGDPGLLRVVLDNLLGNAWKFTRHVPAAAIEFGREARNGEIDYFVRDNGAGFDNAYAKKLFQVFQRLHSEAEFEGTGIGLATVSRIIQRHHGSVSAEGTPGKGATFYFTLPQRAAPRDGTDHNDAQGQTA